MNAEDDAIASLRASGLLAALLWAAPAAFSATDQIHDEDAGHDQGVIGYLNFKHLKDLIDRATSNGRFVLGDDVGGTGADVLERGVTPEVFRTIPTLSPDAVARSDYRQSPGWAANGYRVLLQSYIYGGIDKIWWNRRSDAKRQVASQDFVQQATLFDDTDFGLEVIDGIPDDDDFNGLTLVVAHAFDTTTKSFELYVGQSRNPAYSGDACWHWRQLLLSGGTSAGGVVIARPPALPGDAATIEVGDIDVRIRTPRRAAQSGDEIG